MQMICLHFSGEACYIHRERNPFVQNWTYLTILVWPQGLQLHRLPSFPFWYFTNRIGPRHISQVHVFQRSFLQASHMIASSAVDIASDNELIRQSSASIAASSRIRLDPIISVMFERMCWASFMK